MISALTKIGLCGPELILYLAIKYETIEVPYLVKGLFFCVEDLYINYNLEVTIPSDFPHAHVCMGGMGVNKSVFKAITGTAVRRSDYNTTNNDDNDTRPTKYDYIYRLIAKWAKRMVDFPLILSLDDNEAKVRVLYRILQIIDISLLRDEKG